MSALVFIVLLALMCPRLTQSVGKLFLRLVGVLTLTWLGLAIYYAFSCAMQYVDIVDIKSDNGARGFFSLSARRIVVQKDMSEADTIKTLLHEQAHAWVFAQMPEEKYNRRESEVIAESTAYVVSQWLGIDTSDYSFGYVAGWSSDRTVPELRATIDTIRKTSELMISKIEEARNELYQGENDVA